MHPAISHVLKFFYYDHLPQTLQAISKPFHDLAHEVARRNPESQETTVALRKLLEAKDAAVRAGLPESQPTITKPETVEEAARRGFNSK